MIIAAQTHNHHTTTTSTHAPSLDDIASLHLEMRASFQEINERLTLLEIEQTALTNKFYALLSLIAEIMPQRR